MSQVKSKRRKRINWFTVVILLIGLYFAFHFINNQIQIAELNKVKREKIELLEKEQDKTLAIKEELEKIGTKEYNEYLARKHLEYIYPDEKYILRLDENGELIP